MMIERIIPWVKGKKVLILGFGREGKSTWNVLKKLAVSYTHLVGL